MARRDGGGRVWIRALLLAWTAAAVLAMPLAIAEDKAAVRYTVALTEVERFEGGVEAAIFTCGSARACVGKTRVQVRGVRHEYLLLTWLSGTRVFIVFARERHRLPDLNHGWANPIDIKLAPDGTGSQNAALANLVPEWVYPGFSTSEPTHVPLANIRVTVRREGSAEQRR